MSLYKNNKKLAIYIKNESSSGAFVRWDGTESHYRLSAESIDEIMASDFPFINTEGIEGLGKVIHMIPMLGMTQQEGLVTTNSRVDIQLFASIWKVLGAEVRNIEVKPLNKSDFDLPPMLMEHLFN